MRKTYNIVGTVAVLMIGYVIGSCTPDATGGAATPPGVVLAAELSSNPARVEIVGTGAWVPLPSASATIEATAAPGSMVVRFWAAVACFGTGSKYARVVIDGTPAASAPLAVIPAAGDGQAEITSTIQASRSVPVGSHTTAIEVKIETGSRCVIETELWHLDTELFAV